MNTLTYDFCNFAERYNDKNYMWDEVLVTIDKCLIYFYDKKASPKNQTDRYAPTLAVYPLDKCQVKKLRNYKIGRFFKQNVIYLHCDEKSSIFSFQNEMQMNMCYQTVIHSSINKKKSDNLLWHRNAKALQKKVFSKLHQDTIINKENVNQSNGIKNKNKSTCNLLIRPKIERLKRQVKEENKPLNSMINDMINASGQKNVTFLMQKEEEENIPDHEGSGMKKRSFNKIIQLSLKKTSHELASSGVSITTIPISPKQVANHFPLHFDFDGSVDEGMINSSFYNNNNQSFSLPQAIAPNEKITNIVNRIENYDIHIYDSFIVKKLIKDNLLTKEDFGKIYTQLTNKNLKSRLLIEMIAVSSKRKLKSLIKQKAPEEKIEMFILDTFNSFLGNNADSTYLYDKILPGELNDIYHIDIILDMKKLISLPNLFIVMEYKNRIYFNDNLDVNFMNPLPFVEQDIRYISPFLIMKWNRLCLTNNTSLNTQSSLTMTTIKRIPMNPQLSPNDNERQDEDMKLFKEAEAMNDESRISLVMDIYQLIYEKKYELSLKLCNFYVQKYTDTIFLNPIVYLILLEIYNQTIGIDIAELFFDKSCHILNWLYPNNTCHLIVDVYYTYSLMLMKQTDHYIHDNMTYVAEIMIKTKSLSEMFYEESNEKYIKIHLQYYLFNYLYMEKTLSYEEITTAINAFSANDYKTKEVYFELFIDSLNGDFSNRSMKMHLQHALIQLKKEKAIQ